MNRSIIIVGVNTLPSEDCFDDNDVIFKRNDRFSVLFYNSDDFNFKNHTYALTQIENLLEEETFFLIIKENIEKVQNFISNKFGFPYYQEINFDHYDSLFNSHFENLDYELSKEKITTLNILNNKEKIMDTQDDNKLKDAINMSEIMADHFRENILFQNDYERSILINKRGKDFKIVSFDRFGREKLAFAKQVEMIYIATTQDKGVKHLIINNKKTTMIFRFYKSYMLVLEFKRNDFEGLLLNTTDKLINVLTKYI